jgi:hypothetical protein
MAGSNAHHKAHIEVGEHGFALFLAPDAKYPVLDVNDQPEELDMVVGELQAALAFRRASNADDVRAVMDDRTREKKSVNVDRSPS